MSAKISVWKSCLLLTAVLILSFVLHGCYQGFGRDLFYRLEYHKFKVVDPEGQPIKNVTATFSYKSNFDISGKNSKFHREHIKFDDNGEASRFGWVRHEPSLHSVWADGVYSRNEHWHPIHDSCTIVLLRRRHPTPLVHQEIRFELKDRYQGKLQFRFEDLELSIPYTREQRLAYYWNEKEKKGEWIKKWNTYYRPDIVFDFKPDGVIEAEFASAVRAKPVRYDSAFHGVYEAPSEGYGKMILSRGNYKDPVVFTYLPYREKIGCGHRGYLKKPCYGIMTKLFIDNENYPRYPERSIRFQFYLNLSGNRNLEPAAGYEPGSQSWKEVRNFSPGQSALWHNGTAVIAPSAILEDFRNRKPSIPKATPRVVPKKIFELRSEKIRYVFIGYDGTEKLSYTESFQYIMPDAKGSILLLGVMEAGHEPEMLDVNFDGIPDLQLHHKCRGDMHRYRFFWSDTKGPAKRIEEIPSNIADRLTGKLTVDPEKRLIHVARPKADGTVIQRTYQIKYPWKSYFDPDYLTEYHPSSPETSANRP